jgi:hypothetical protein
LRNLTTSRAQNEEEGLAEADGDLVGHEAAGDGETGPAVPHVDQLAEVVDRE